MAIVTREASHMLTPTEEMRVLRELPESFSKAEIFAMIDTLQDAIKNERAPKSWTDRVKDYSYAHSRLLVSYPLLYRSVCRGTYRPEVVEALLDAREHMASGMSKKDALDIVIRRAVEEVTETRQRQQENGKTAPSEK
jgi:hypothetical protein